MKVNSTEIPEYLSSITLYLDSSVICFFLLTKRGEMDIYVNKSDAVWKMGTKGSLSQVVMLWTIATCNWPCRAG